MKQCARVVAVDGDTARVLPDGSRCPGCAGGHCKRSLRTVTVANPLGLNLQIADTVEVSTSLVRGVADLALLVLLPTGVAAATALVGARFLDQSRPEVVVAFAILGAVIGLFALFGLAPHQRERSLPHISAVVSGQPALSSTFGTSGGPGRIVSSDSNS